MKNHAISFIFGLSILIAGVSLASAQRLQTPQVSQKAVVMQRLGLTDISITYSRPSVRGRHIFDNAPPEMVERGQGERTLDNQILRKTGEPIVPYGHVWRAGANEATVFAVNDDVLINGKPLPKGSYSLHMIPGTKEFTVIFNKDDGQWGSFGYDAAKDALRVTVKPEWLKSNTEFLTYAIEPAVSADGKATATATISLQWEKLRVPFTIEVKDLNSKALGHIREVAAAAKPDDAATPMAAANWARTNGFTDAGKEFLEQALRAVDKRIAKKAAFGDLRQKATILTGLGRHKEALATAEKALAEGKRSGAKPDDLKNVEKQIDDLKAKQ
ncbi:MAG: DUF2911 domain-containing protein [Chloracidobacterium sp.]|nr:DUF2911 domain-containing protein [Chloracidobacterium sp.]MCC6826258.1 DUF2911 domain-containing protein [Acidobacteriota bacterium]MCO5333000.1 DUF2911 domain-containing protein [Pyrinomonadaceae bacterium]